MLNRRHFLGTVAAASLCRPAASQNVDLRLRKNPYEALYRDIEPGHDDFPIEKEATEIESRLKAMTRGEALPFADEFRGSSPLPTGYASIGPDLRRAEFNPADRDVEGGLKLWLASVGGIREARFYALPDDLIRYEISTNSDYRVGLWKQSWVDGKLTHFSPVEEILAQPAEPLFREVTTRVFRGTDSFPRQLAQGIPYWRTRLDVACGIDVHANNGIAVGDIDDDGWDEIYVCQPGGLANRLYKNRGDGTLEDITDRAGVGVLDTTTSALFADFRNIGRQDLLVVRPDGPLLFLNQGDNRFTLKPNAFRFKTTPQGTFTGVSAADYDRDGRLDLYFCSYVFFQNEDQYLYPVPFQDAENGPPNFLFHNALDAEGNGAFEDVTEAAGLNQNNKRYSFSPAWCDYNGDGWPDLYVANDFGRNNLYRNDKGHFRDMAAEAGVEDIGPGMSASWFDYDGDGRPDLYVSNMWTAIGQRVVKEKNMQPAEAWRRHAKGNSLYRNRGDGTFEETGPAEGVEMGRWAWSSGGIDFDNDGTPEIFVTAGMLTNSSEKDLESFFWRKVAAGSPSTAKSDSGYESAWNALGQASHEEYSLSGRQPNVFYVRRNGRYYDFSGVSGLDLADDSRAFATLDLDGDGSLDLIVKNRLGPQVRVFQNNCGRGRPSLAIRLRGTKSNRDAIGARVEVDGKVQFLAAGSGYLSQHTKVLHFVLPATGTASSVKILWPSGAEQQFHDLAAGRRYQIQEGSDEVKSTPFLAKRDIAAAAIPGTHREQFADTWLIEPVPLPERFTGGPAFLHIPETVSGDRAVWYNLFCRCLFDLRADVKFPIWFLVDEQSRAHKIYFTPPDPDDLLKMKLDRLSLALPLPGIYVTAPKRNYSTLGATFFHAGYPEVALPYLERAPQDSYRILFALGQVHLGAGRPDPARRYFEQGLRLKPDSADGWNNLGGVEMIGDHFAAALKNYEKALALRPDMTAALFNAGQANLGLGNLDAGEQLFQRVLELKPNDPDAANQMGQILVRRKRDSEARRWFQQAIAARRDFADAIRNLGSVYERLGQNNDAIAAFRYGLDVAPDDELIYLSLASLYVKTGNRQGAREVIERLLARKPDSAEGRRALRELEVP